MKEELCEIGHLGSNASAKVLSIAFKILLPNNRYSSQYQDIRKEDLMSFLSPILITVPSRSKIKYNRRIKLTNQDAKTLKDA